MSIALAVLCMISLSAGLVLRLIGSRHRTEFGRQIRWYHVNHWFNPGINAHILTETGRRYHSYSQLLIMVGLALYAVVFGIGPLA